MICHKLLIKIGDRGINKNSKLFEVQNMSPYCKHFRLLCQAEGHLETVGKEGALDLPVPLKSGHRTSLEKDTVAQETRDQAETATQRIKITPLFC